MAGKKVDSCVAVDDPRYQVRTVAADSGMRVSKVSVALALLFAACASTSVIAGQGEDDDDAYKKGVMTRGSDTSAGTPLDTTTYPCNKTGTCDSVRDAVTIAAPKCDAQLVYWGPGNSCGASVPMMSDVSTDGLGQFRKATMSLWDVLQGNGGSAVVSCLSTGRLNVDSQSCPPAPAPSPAPYYAAPAPTPSYGHYWPPVEAPAPAPYYSPAPAPAPYYEPVAQTPAPPPCCDAPPPPPPPCCDASPPPAPAPAPTYVFYGYNDWHVTDIPTEYVVPPGGYVDQPVFVGPPAAQEREQGGGG